MSTIAEVEKDKTILNAMLDDLGIDNLIFHARRVDTSQEYIRYARNTAEGVLSNGMLGKKALSTYFSIVGYAGELTYNPSIANQLRLVPSRSLTVQEFDTLKREMDCAFVDPKTLSGFEIKIRDENGRTASWGERYDEPFLNQVSKISSLKMEA